MRTFHLELKILNFAIFSSMKELPENLDVYEFQREMKRDQDYNNTWHLVNKTNPATFTPYLTEGNIPIRQEFSWSQFFDDDKPIEVEIGSGKGGFTLDYAEKRPDINIMGSEWDTKCARYGGSRIEKHQISNAVMLHGDLFYFLRDYVPDDSVSAFHMYFPDPWPKKRQRKKRLMKPELLENILRATKPGGDSKFYWGTDFQEYNEVAQELFAETPWLELEIQDAEPTYGIMTNFEKKYREEGRPIYRSVFKILK